ncbi:hypothetical protein E2562_037001 [Oryza meyeriana var. granulata]|uniref:Uncharacterized protein n=1 Tax=Oryza meyeriana var. granulata TaxID=110450 RepID=A0A6G1F1Z3_9ORYZ|nr:hypothetical protein E2562_037001 [Oryza meyeriana var. granulata]
MRQHHRKKRPSSYHGMAKEVRAPAETTAQQQRCRHRPQDGMAWWLSMSGWWPIGNERQTEE